MCWPSLRRLWMRILGINSPVAFFLTFTRYQYANVIYQFWSLSFGINSFSTWQLCLLTVILTDVHIHERTKINPTKGKSGTACIQLSSTNFGQVSTELVPQSSRTQDNSRDMRQYWLPKSKLWQTLRVDS